MKTCIVLYGALLAAPVVLSQEDPLLKKSIGLDQVLPFPEPEAKTISDKAAVKFKPQIHVSEGCQSYPAVNAAGDTTDGLKIEGLADGKCKGSTHGSQVYVRSTWHRGKWATMYAWHFPTYTADFERYDWEHVVLWLDNPAVANQTLEAVSIWDELYHEYSRAVPPERRFINGSSLKLDMVKTGPRLNISLSTLDGQFQPLIMWDQMPNKSRSALDTVKWHAWTMPLSDSRFTVALENAWPFAPVEAPPPVGLPPLSDDGA